MRTFKITCDQITQANTTFQVEDDWTDEQIHELAFQIVCEYLDFAFDEVKA